MRTIRIKLYKFNELSKTAKEAAIEQYRNDNSDLSNMDYLFEEAWQTVQKFAAIFDMDIESIDFLDHYRSKYSFMNIKDEVLELSGQRLATYIWNNYKTDLYKGKYYSKGKYTYVNPINPNDYKYDYVCRRSKIILEHSCVLTGVCYDDDILEPIYNFLDKPNNNDLKDLIENCLSSICKSVESEIKANFEDDAIADHMSANEYEFTKNGKLN